MPFYAHSLFSAWSNITALAAIASSSLDQVYHTSVRLENGPDGLSACAVFFEGCREHVRRCGHSLRAQG